MKCIIHKDRQLIPCNTKYGKRYACPDRGCTVVAWQGSTPATLETRQARHEAHNIFDRLWQSKAFSRGEIYKKLAEYMGLKVKKTHIGRFSQSQCSKVIKFTIITMVKITPPKTAAEVRQEMDEYFATAHLQKCQRKTNKQIARAKDEKEFSEKVENLFDNL